MNPPRYAKAIVEDGKLSGYAVCRQCHDGYKVGPLFADDINLAVLLLRASPAAAGGETLHIDVPASQAEFSAHLSGLGFSKGFTTARMYRGRAPTVQIQGIFGVTTLELG
ncbi:hypothetical protein [Neorhizobium sp. DT-125]|uniref:hypothetical protein n=1 Tax=Neorhizobium sp. DT-125 TaxID=3396163 RepID=UPI003F1DF7B7